ncbi:hypothetical protein [Xanthomonas arboricola]|uniref:hypothetical protein n=1 Tax=Xanthomonas arboricola TaxID=56448 RepID=UPI0011B0ECDC|nr:hypothetical protein [Xanthomonas arboricola]
MTNPSWWDRAKAKSRLVLNSQIKAHPGRDLVLLVLAVISAFSCAISVYLVYQAKTLGSSPSIYLAILSFGLTGTQAFVGACRSLKLHFLWVMIAAGASIGLTVVGLWGDGTLFN